MSSATPSSNPATGIFKAAAASKRRRKFDVGVESAHLVRYTPHAYTKYAEGQPVEFVVSTGQHPVKLLPKPVQITYSLQLNNANVGADNKWGIDPAIGVAHTFIEGVHISANQQVIFTESGPTLAVYHAVSERMCASKDKAIPLGESDGKGVEKLNMTGLEKIIQCGSMNGVPFLGKPKFPYLQTASGREDEVNEGFYLPPKTDFLIRFDLLSGNLAARLMKTDFSSVNYLKETKPPNTAANELALFTAQELPDGLQVVIEEIALLGEVQHSKNFSLPLSQDLSFAFDAPSMLRTAVAKGHSALSLSHPLPLKTDVVYIGYLFEAQFLTDTKAKRPQLPGVFFLPKNLASLQLKLNDSPILTEKAISLKSAKNSPSYAHFIDFMKTNGSLPADAEFYDLVPQGANMSGFTNLFYVPLHKMQANDFKNEVVVESYWDGQSPTGYYQVAVWPQQMMVTRKGGQWRVAAV